MEILKKKWLHPAAEAQQGALPAGDTATEATGPEEGTPAMETTTGEESEPRLVSMTQEELDKLLNRQFAKGARQAKKELAAGADAPLEEDAAAEEQKAAEALLARARERELKAAVRELAAQDGVKLTARGATAALRMADFTDCYAENGELCEEKVKLILRSFAREWPELVQRQAPPPYAVGTGRAASGGDTFKDVLGLV